MAKELIPVIATIMINIGLTIPALTAAWPRTMAPTIPRVGPIGDGTLSPASLIISNEISIIKISKIIGNGTLCLEDKIEYNNSVGIISLWKLVIAIYNPGNNSAKKAAIILITFKKFANIVFKFVSSGEDRKSIKTAGIINAYGEPFTITITLPCNSAFTALSGLSDTRILGRPRLLVSVIIHQQKEENQFPNY